MMKVTRLQPTTLPPPPGARSVVDIALWDWLGKYVRLPIHKLLGGSCRRIQAYASTPRLSRAEAYVDFTSQLRAEGFTAIKFHAWCEPDRDLEMVRAVRRVHSEPCGGITAARKVMTIAEAAGCRCERQCWGYTLSQAANLQTMLGLPNCSFFEQPVPYDAFEYGMFDVIRPRADGYVYAADAAGLGVRVDWDAIRGATLSKIQFSEKASGHAASSDGGGWTARASTGTNL